MKQVRDNFEETEPAGKDDKEIFGAEETVEILLELLQVGIRIVLVVKMELSLPEAVTASRVVDLPLLA